MSDSDPITGLHAYLLVVVVLAAGCSAPDRAITPQEVIEWSLDGSQGISLWGPASVDAATPAAGEGLHLTLGDQARGQFGDFGGGIYVDLDNRTATDWGSVEVRVRTESEAPRVYMGWNRWPEAGPPGPEYRSWRNPFVDFLWQPLEADGAVHSYVFPTDQIPWNQDGRLGHLGVWLTSRAPSSFEILSVRLLPQTDDAEDPPRQACVGLKALGPEQLPNPTTEVSLAYLDVGERDEIGGSTGLPGHCRIQGRMNERIGVNDQPYAINFRMRLPTDWNGRLFFAGGGGFNGQLNRAMGNLSYGVGPVASNALGLGYAIVTQDGGHDWRINYDPTLNGSATFGFDPQARLDWAYNSLDEVTKAAKAVIEAYYGRPAERSYYWGVSDGGREAMTMAHRFPRHFDGIVAISPAVLRALGGVKDAWETQVFAEVARAGGLFNDLGQPHLNKTFTDEDLALVSDAVKASCDDLDGLADGLIDNFPACTTDRMAPGLGGLTCSGEKNAHCLSEVQVRALKAYHDGPTDSLGEPFFAARSWDAGVGGKSTDSYFTGWRFWVIGPYDGTLYGWDATGPAAVMTTPPDPLPDSGPDAMAYLLNFDFDSDPQKIYATTETYETSVHDLLVSTSTDMQAFRDHGSKLIVIAGVSDPVVPTNDIIKWWEAVDSAQGGTADHFVRLFPVPGMAHWGGPATDRFDALSAIVEWVEEGIAPERIIASAGEQTAWPNRTRPLCPYPRQPRYQGSGSIEEAGSFQCREVDRVP